MTFEHIPIAAMRLDEEYLADGVYIHHDGCQIWLTTSRGADRSEVEDAIAIEPHVIPLIAKYWERMLYKYRKPEPAMPPDEMEAFLKAATRQSEDEPDEWTPKHGTPR